MPACRTINCGARRIHALVVVAAEGLAVDEGERGDDADDAVVAAFAKHRETCVAAGASTVPAVFLDPSPRLASAALATFPDALVSVSGAVTHAKNVSLLEVAFDVPAAAEAARTRASGRTPRAWRSRRRKWRR